MPLARIADLNGPAEEIERRIGHARALSRMYDEFLDFEQEETPDDGSRPAGIHGSELYPCMRKSHYSLADFPKRKRITKFWLQRFKVGHAIHEMLQQDFARMARRSLTRALVAAEQEAKEMNCYLNFEDEVEVSPKLQELAAYYQLHSHCDGIFSFIDRTTHEVMLRVGLEIKTEAPDGYNDLKKPKEEHIRQAHLYMAALDVPLMWFFYMNKGNQNNTNSESPWLTVWQPQVWEEMQNRMLLVHQTVQQKQLPEKTEGIWCEFCPWSWTCQPDALSKAPPIKATSRRELVTAPRKP